MTRILFSLCFALMFSVSAHAIMARPGGTQDRMVPAPRPPQVMCTQEAKICPDGTGVGRTGPHCEFAPCPGEQAGGDNGAAVMACTKDAKACPDGSTVGRVPPSCAFALCPGEESEEGQNPDDVVSSPPVEENPGQTTPMPPPGIACPAMAKLCPDGSSVSPTGPNCEYAPCPGETPPAETLPNEGAPGGTPGTAPGGAPGMVPGNPGVEGGSEGQ